MGQTVDHLGGLGFHGAQKASEANLSSGVNQRQHSLRDAQNMILVYGAELGNGLLFRFGT